LALGNISPRTIYFAAKRYEKERGLANKSTYWLIFELIWRDFFRFFSEKHGKKIFLLGGARDSNPQQWNTDPEKIRRWKEGRTGWPLVDANMRELAATGWMSNRGRQNVASFLILDWAVDWRVGADWFESQLLDHDVCSNYGNWNAAAGLTGGRVNRFNIAKQSKDYDPTGAYLRHWLPELARVPAPKIFEPWKLSPQEQAKYEVQIGVDYPRPLPSAPPPAYDSAPRGGGNAGRGRGDKRGRGGGAGARGAQGQGQGQGSTVRGEKKEKNGKDIRWYLNKE
jgi:deoxyribodipyrimidine photo-lyase